MNYKLEKFWNMIYRQDFILAVQWTINLKSFEIRGGKIYEFKRIEWTINLKSFEI